MGNLLWNKEPPIPLPAEGSGVGGAVVYAANLAQLLQRDLAGVEHDLLYCGTATRVLVDGVSYAPAVLMDVLPLLVERSGLRCTVADLERQIKLLDRRIEELLRKTTEGGTGE